jgi:hypothetical protein
MDTARKNNAVVANELHSHGLPLMQDNASKAAKSNAKDALEVLFEKGWNINSPTSQGQPPILR